MKRLYTVMALFSLLCQGLFAGPIDQIQALKLAGNFFGTTGRQLKMEYKASYKAATRAGKAEENLFYIINRGDNQGYVVIAADDRVMPVIAYSDKGNLTEEDIRKHPSVKWLYDEYCNQIKWAVENMPDKPSAEYRRVAFTRTPKYAIEIQPLLEYATDRRTKLATPISWGQQWPFNLYSPNYRYNGRIYPTVSGCVATAISTVLRWHKWPRKAKGAVSYYWKGNRMSLDFEGDGSENAAYDWEQMPAGIDSYGRDRTTNNRISDVQADNIGRLLRDIGYAVQMDYNPASFGGSGAYVYNAPRILTNNFGYKNTVRFLERNNYYADAWLKEIHDEMLNYGPVVYAGFSSGGGHCFVLDGYASNGYVHVDWGWNYSSNGWHLLNVLQPGTEGVGGGSGGYRSSQQMLRYLTPDQDDEPEPKPKPEPDYESGANLFIAQKCPQTILRQRNYVPVTVTVGNRNTTANYTGRLALAVYQENASHSTIVSTASATVNASSKKEVTFYANLANIPTGKYNLTVNYAHGYGYKAIDEVAGTVTIGKVEPEPEPKPSPVVKGPELYSVLKVVEYARKGQNMKIPVTMTNEGDEAYDGKLMLYTLPQTTADTKSAVKVSEGDGKIGKNQRVTFSFYTNDKFKELETGKYNLIIGYFVNGKEKAVKLGSDQQIWKIGELTIDTEEEDFPETVHDVKMQTAFFYQNGRFLGTDNSFISTENDKFTARIYLKSVNGFEGRVKFYVTETESGTKPLNSKMAETKTVKLAANSNGYIDIPFLTRYLTKTRYYINILYNNGENSWLYYPTDVVPFYVRRTSNAYNEEDGIPTMGPTFNFNVSPYVNNNFQSIGYNAEGDKIEEQVTGIKEMKTNSSFSVFPYISDTEVTISSTGSGIAYIYNVQGKLIGKYYIKTGDNVLNVSNLAVGIYLIKIGDTTQKLIRK
ncbi:thiol protease/hemagglutinin PrtT [Prevotella denticola]|nr:C10 family peptidase [Prevotella denticola]QUI94736.1 thiol protease/hemagglutinin PrtT [Prevotella denticola]